jgi:tetratricopeptide (TPR) repeat protein
MSDVVLYRFQPDAMDKETLKRLFLGENRRNLLNKLTKEIENAVENRTPRYYLIIGPRGVGKTHSITLLYYNVIEQIENVLAIKLSEEEYSLYRVSDLLLRILGMTGKRERNLSDFEQMSDDEVVVAALDELKSMGKMIVLFLENLNQILGEQMSKKEVQRLRSIFQTENIFTVVTTAPLVFPQVSEHQEPFFNFFDIIYLKELTRAELKELVREIAVIENDEAFLSKMDVYGQKIDAVGVLTGGSPRMAMLLYDLMSKGKLVDVEKAFFKLLDENTPYYQDVFRLLSAEKRKVFDTLIAIGSPATPKEIAKKARLDDKTVNTQLKRLEKDGYVLSRRMGKRTRYEVRERLFRLWRELRRQPFAIQKLSIFVEFLELWYSVEERKEKFLRDLKDLRDVMSETRVREINYWFLSLPKEYTKELIPRVVEEIYEAGEVELLDGLLIYEDRELKGEAVKAELGILLEKGKHEAILEKAEELIKADKNDVPAWRIKSVVLGALGRYEEALVASSKCVESTPEEANAWLVNGMALKDLGRHEEALVAFSKALELDPKFDIAWRQKGEVLGNIERHEEALEAFSKSIELNSEGSVAWLGKGLSLVFLERPEEALGASSKAVELDPKFDIAWELKGLIHLHISSRDFINKNYGNALENLNSAMAAFDTLCILSEDKEEDITGDLMAFLKRLIDAKTVEAVDMALESIGKNKEELKEVFEPISTAVEIVKGEDVSRYYELQVERREVVADIVKRLTGSEELLPEEYKGS